MAASRCILTGSIQSGGNVEVGRSVSKAIADRLMGDMEPAMLHACNAVDGTAKKMYPNQDVGARFRKLLRDNYAGILEPMMPGVNLEKTVFPISISGASGPGGKPDVADILYKIHRCNHGHGDAVPVGYELIPDTTTEPARTTMKPEAGPNGDWVVHLSDRIIYGMAAVALLAPVNVGQVLQGSLHLTWSSISGDIGVRLDNGWWGRVAEFAAITAMDRKRISVTLDFSNQMPPPTP
jgi:hypothetical protein